VSQKISRRMFCEDVFREKLLRWWVDNRRDMPWRHSADPYSILIAEVLLHRTRAEQVVSVYNRFMERYPSIATIADSNVTEVSAIMKGLGLTWRARSLYEMAVQIQVESGGDIPKEKDHLMSLPGVSDYIASAVRCFGYGYPEVLLDTNTVRVCGRLFGRRINDSSRRSQTFRRDLTFLLDVINPRDFNYAMIDLAAKVCRSKSPDCEICPVSEFCVSRRRHPRDA
jgi:A/G-specific adenine glycosylase